MKELKSDRRTRYTRKALQDSLIELMKEKPIAKITIKELCEKADINRTTFYAHYTDPYDLLRKIEEEVLLWWKEAISTILGKQDKQGVLRELEEICRYFTDNSRHLRVLMSERGDIAFQKELFSMIYEQYETTASAAGGSKLSTGKGDGFIFIVSGSVGLLQYWLKNGFTKNVREMAETIYNLAFPIY